MLANSLEGVVAFEVGRDIGVKRKCQVLLVSSVAPKSAGVLASGLQYVLTCVVKHKCRALVSSVCVERLGQAFKSSVVGVKRLC